MSNNIGAPCNMKGMDWEKLEFDRCGHGGARNKRTKEVWLITTEYRYDEGKRKQPSLNRIGISYDLLDKAGLVDGDGLDIYRGEAGMFKFQKARSPKTADMVLKRTSETSSGMVNCKNGAVAIKVATGCEVFDGWAGDGVIFFKPKEDEE